MTSQSRDDEAARGAQLSRQLSEVEKRSVEIAEMRRGRSETPRAQHGEENGAHHRLEQSTRNPTHKNSKNYDGAKRRKRA